ncbi:LacI family DNA-binding transcriptional regulator [Maribacter sp. Asnod2-G09]|uniref:LacI family DNA-binding transcriptional regulator n=1 Tax=Maribacter sp. Asnod2-G09 TaxID=3160577 RepID=UPI003868D8B1
MKYITIKDVAKKLNLSTSSISRAFNDKYDIKKETKELILKTAKEMGYFPNPIAQRLSQKKTFNIGIIVPEFINEHYAEIALGIQEILMISGYQVILMQSDENSEVELKNVIMLTRNMVDGLIIAPTSSKGSNMDYYMKLIDNGYPIVFVSRAEKSLEASKVLFNNEKWSYFATEHLILQNYKKIYYICGPKGQEVSEDRINGFKKAMSKYKFPKENYKILEAGLMTNDGIEAAQDLIYNQDIPDAIFCFNDRVAMGVIKALQGNGYKIPEDIAIMSFTETRMAELVTPKLSSVKQPTSEMGRKAGELLLNLMSKESEEHQTIIMNGDLNIRESSVAKP